MYVFFRFTPALALAAGLLFAAPASAQVDREDEEDAREEREDRERAERDRVRIFRHRPGDDRVFFRHPFPPGHPLPPDAEAFHFERDGDTLIFRTPDGEEHVLVEPGEWTMLADSLHDRVFRFHVGPEMEALRERFADFERLPRLEHFERSFDGHPFMMEGPGAHVELFGLDGLGFGGSEETRREMRELERRAHDLAREARRADRDDRARLEAELDEVLDDLFEIRGRAREEEAQRLRERATELERRADELEQAVRERARERRALIEQRKRELLGEDESDW
ncbi:MAG TPA: hypothetical protein VD962_05840 [Rubricoccaceae bacterium]|nr:hypothetical protein [Rubricoccaceae bacterium]